MVDAADLAEAPTITLGGRQWSVPELAVRQIKRLIPAIGRLQKIGLELVDAMTEEEVGWIYDVAFIGLERGHRELTREAFDDLPIKIHEIMTAIPVITRQAGLEFQEISKPEQALLGQTSLGEA